MSVGEKSTFSDNDTYDVYETDAFEEAIDKLYEKRTDTRETGLKKLISLFTSQWQFDDSVLRCETLSSMLLRCLKKGGASEASLAARALGLHAITLGSGSEAEGVWAQGRAVLAPMVQSRSASGASSAVARTSALEALGVLCFVGAEGEHETMETLELCEGVFSALRAAPEVKAAALRTWALLLTTVPGWHLGTPFVERLLGLLGALLHDGDVGVRTAAGDALALVYDVCGLATLPGEAEADSDVSGRGFGLEGSFEEDAGEVRSRARARDEKGERSGTLPVPAEELSSALEALCVEDGERGAAAEA
ncbi:interferon-related developmental regulator, partial [Helicosporidium sp. ATCC 50920]